MSRRVIAAIGLVALLMVEAPPFGPHGVAAQSADLSEAATLNQQGAALFRDGRYAEAEPLLRRALAIREEALGAGHPSIATSLNNLAALLYVQGRYAEAEPLYRRALAIRENALGAGHPDVAQSFNNLAALYRAQGRFADAEPAYRRALAIQEQALGAEHPDVATTLNNLAGLYYARGRHDDAEPLYRRALAIREKALGADHPGVATSANNLAGLYYAQGRYTDAEPLFRRALAIRETALGADHPDVAQGLNNLAGLYRALGRTAEIEPLYLRALAIQEKALGAEHPDVAASLNNLAALYHGQGRYADAEPHFRRALAIQEKVLGAEHPNVAISLNNLAGVHHALSRYADAEPLYWRALAIQERALGVEHANVATSLNNLAGLYDAQGRYADAEPLYRRALAIQERSLGADHPDVAVSLGNLAWLHRAQGRHADALAPMRRATAIVRARLAVADSGRSGAREQRSERASFVSHVALAARLAHDRPDEREAMTLEAFEVGQLARTSSAAQAIGRVAARFAAGSDALAGIARAKQDLADRWRTLDEALIKVIGEPPERRDAGLASAIRSQMQAADTELAAIDARLQREFPRYAEIASPQPVALAEARGMLGDDEAMLVWLVDAGVTHVWVLRRHRAMMFEAAVGRRDLDAAVAALRRGLDPTGSRIRRIRDLPPFDMATAFDLYRKLLAPAEPLLAGARNVFVVPDGALQSLPIGVLVSERPAGDVMDLSGYRQASWVARAYAVTVLPSVSSLRALRRFAQPARANRPFLGVGDPALGGDSGGASRGPVLATLFRGAQADVEAVRRLAPLPDSADELRRVARSLGAGDDALLLRADATERRIRVASLADYRVLAFATHGLVAGEMKGLVEPALVLTPPAAASPEDDGLLTASEIAQLSLDADWVVLSACNTAASDGTAGAEGLSGLAKAFFHAGSRALLVSHWPVFSDAAVRLTSGAFDALAQDPAIGRAEAMRRSIAELIADSGNPHFAHPMFWAPFVVVGEGGPGR